MKIEIKSWLDGGILFAGEFGSLKIAVEAAVSKGISLNYARLDGARLDGARLDGARLDGARLDPIKNDLWVVLCTSPLEVPGLRKALLDGRVNGSTYEGECACLVGTIANVKGCKFNAMPNLKPDSDRPIERFFLAIRKGDTPENSQFAKLAVEWIDEWQRNINQLVCK